MVKKTPRTDSLEKEVKELRVRIEEVDDMLMYAHCRIDELINGLKEATQYLDSD